MSAKTISSFTSGELPCSGLLEGLYLSECGWMKTAPSFQDSFQTNREARLLYLSAGGGVGGTRGREQVLGQRDIFFAFPGERFFFRTDSQTPAEIWWLELYGQGLGGLLEQLALSPERPLIRGISDPRFHQEMKSIQDYCGSPSPADMFHIVSGLYKVFALLLEECTTSQWVVVPHGDQAILYTGNWVAWPSPFNSRHEEFYTAARAAYAEYNFYGTGIKWLGTMNFDCGKADVIIDGRYETTVDCYSPVRLSKQLLYLNTKLPAGHHIIKIFCTGARNDKATNCDIVVESFQYLGAGVPEFQSERATHTRLAKRAVDMMKANYTQTLTVDQIAQALGVNRSYLSTRFTSEMGVPPARYLMQIRLGQAKGLLRSTDLPIGKIAIAVGYPDLFYFSRLFKREENVTPSQYRQLGHSEEPTPPDLP